MSNNSIHDDVHLLVATVRLLLLPNSKMNFMQSWKWKTLIDLFDNHQDENVKWFVRSIEKKKKRTNDFLSG